MFPLVARAAFSARMIRFRVSVGLASSNIRTNKRMDRRSIGGGGS